MARNSAFSHPPLTSLVTLALAKLSTLVGAFWAAGTVLVCSVPVPELLGVASRADGLVGTILGFERHWMRSSGLCAGCDRLLGFCSCWGENAELACFGVCSDVAGFDIPTCWRDEKGLI